MANLVPVLVVAFAAFCVWLTVRIINRRERWAKWTLMTSVGVPMLYILSFGPACWWFSRPVGGPYSVSVQVSHAYWPVGLLVKRSPRWMRKAVSEYARLGARAVFVPTSPHDDNVIFLTDGKR